MAWARVRSQAQFGLCTDMQTQEVPEAREMGGGRLVNQASKGTGKRHLASVLRNEKLPKLRGRETPPCDPVPSTRQARLTAPEGKSLIRFLGSLSDRQRHFLYLVACLLSFATLHQLVEEREVPQSEIMT